MKSSPGAGDGSAAEGLSSLGALREAAQVPEPTWQLTTIKISSSWGSDAFF